MTDRSRTKRRRGGDAGSAELVSPGSTGKKQPRKPYAPPNLECYGKLSEVTRFGGSTVVDSGSGSLGDQPFQPP